MRKHRVEWTTTYRNSDVEFVEAESPEEAEDIVRERIDSREGSMKYIAAEIYVEAKGDWRKIRTQEKKER